MFASGGKIFRYCRDNGIANWIHQEEVLSDASFSQSLV